MRDARDAGTPGLLTVRGIASEKRGAGRAAALEGLPTAPGPEGAAERGAAGLLTVLAPASGARGTGVAGPGDAPVVLWGLSGNRELAAG